MTAWTATFSRQKTTFFELFMGRRHVWAATGVNGTLLLGEVYESFSCSKTSCNASQPGQALLLLMK